jgi:hypothetical protein
VQRSLKVLFAHTGFHQKTLFVGAPSMENPQGLLGTHRPIPCHLLKRAVFLGQCRNNGDAHHH